MEGKCSEESEANSIVWYYDKLPVCDVSRWPEGTASSKIATLFGIQLDETTDIRREAQLIVHCRFPDIEEKPIVEHYLCCLQLGIETTAYNIFQNLNGFIIEEGID